MKNKKRLKRIITGALFFAIASLVDDRFKLILYILSYISAGGDVVLKAFKNILRGKVFDENFLMAIATLGAFLIGEYPEGIAVILFYQIGEYFQDYAVNQSRKSISDLMDIRPDYANVKRGNKVVKIDPDEVKIGDNIAIKAGERIPLDGKVIDGNSMVDTSALTGESLPRECSIGSDVLSGCINVNGVLTVQVSKEYEDSTVSKILDLVENASSKKSNSENFITKFARYYTPVVVIVAAIIAIIPPIVFDGAQFSDWAYRALTFLVILCPCALVISVPLSFFGGIGGASKLGILVKGSNYLELLSQAEVVVFDKTGTLTKGVFKVQEINPKGMSKDDLLKLTTYAENYSNHPISISLKEAYGKKFDGSKFIESQEIAGHGVRSIIDGNVVYAGNYKLMDKIGVKYFKGDIVGTVVHVAVNDKYAGYIVISDEIKPDSKEAIRRLKKYNVKRTVMLTGDAKRVGEKVANELAMDLVYTELLPGEKVEKVEDLIRSKSEKGKLAFVGDGINDAPVLARSDIGIAMGGLGSDAAIEAADVVIMTDEPSKIATAMKIAKRTLRIVRQNIIFALGVKLIVLILGASGVATMWEAVFADVGVSVIAILNAMRALNVKNID